jgi:DNA-binding response OmpR family regulator
VTTYRVLVVDDDLGTRETFSAALHLAGYAVASAACGADALAVASSVVVDAAVLDLRLPDMSGLEVARRLRQSGHPCSFVLVSGFLTTQETVEAVRLGAAEVLDKPVATDTVCRVVARALTTAALSDSTRVGDVLGQRGPPLMWRSSVERWAQAVLHACDAKGDPRTLQHWAHEAGLSYTSLRDLCDILAIKPHDARDFARVLRAVVQGQRQRCAPSFLLDVADSRTLRRLFQRAGVDPSLAAPWVEDFCDRQRFINPTHPGVRLVRLLLAGTKPQR